MIRTVDFDLTDPDTDPLFGDEQAWILVRAGPLVLGELRVGNLDEGIRRLRADGPRMFADQLLNAPRPPQTPSPTPASETSGSIKPLDVSVVICTRERPDHLADCLRHLGRLDPQPGEILVVDNGIPGGRTQSLADDNGMEYTAELHPGLDRARNHGWRHAEGSVIAYIDDDARAHPSWIAGLAAGFSASGVGAVTGLVLPYELDTYPQICFERDEGGMGKGFRPRIWSRSDVGLRSFQVGVGTNMAIRRSLLEHLGGFDERLDAGTSTRGGGDLDMFRRVLDAGHLIAYEPNAVVRHIHRRDRAGLVAQSHDNGVAYRAYLAAQLERSPSLRQSVRRERWRWHLHRHGLGALRALRSGQLLHLQLVVAEFRGSFSGVRALETETQLDLVGREQR